MTELLLNSPFFYGLALSLIHFLWQGLLVALVLKSALFLIPDNKPQLRYGCTALAMAICLLLPVLTFFIISQPDNAQLSHLSQLMSPQNALDPDLQSSGYFWNNDLFEYFPYISMAWLISVLLLACKLLTQVYLVNQLPKLSTQGANNVLQARFIMLVKQMKLSKVPKLLISLKAEVPMAIGWIKPVILLPASMICGLTTAQLDMLILHELAHIRRHDYLVNFLQTLVEILLFFHPCIHWIAKKMRAEREYCSDDIAVSVCGDAIAYAHTLTDTAALCTKHRHHTIPAMAMAASGGDLKQRVVRLVNHHCSASQQDSGKWLASFTVISSILLVGSLLALPQQLRDLTLNNLPFYQVKGELSFDARTTGFEPDFDNAPIAQQLLSSAQPQIISPAVKQLQQKVPAQEVKPVEVKVAYSSPPVITKKKLTLPTTKITKATPAKVLIIEPQENTLAQNHIDEKQEFSRQASNIVAYTQAAQIKTSTSEQAFRRTDSTNRFSPVNNPYANQVAALARGLSQEKPSTAKTLTVSQADKYPQRKETRINARLLSSKEPKYPSSAKRKGIELEVKVRFTIDANGSVKNIIFDQHGKANYFKRTIRNAMAKWKFLPAHLKGKPVESQMTKIFSFSLKG